eukprot:TRINITY_DN10071_c0_g1_i1.p1 TRINITY_DN10071_c0_g1~~TRINITY_DN10071_c0_g1_i1.p1  ORF type:complete len:180 (+),score=27.14 TRINITY_DN10071_c0_g1_i1:138-677(+)
MEIEDLRAKISELEGETKQLEAEMQNTTGAVEDEARKEIDARSVYVGNVDYETKPEELQELFSGSGTVNRVTIVCGRSGQPKGFAYLEFVDKASVDEAIKNLDGTTFRGRQIKVFQKRTNLPGLCQTERGYRGYRSPYRGRYAASYSPYGRPGRSSRPYARGAGYYAQGRGFARRGRPY